MKTTLKKVIRMAIFFIVLILFGNTLIAQNAFEGKIKFKIQDKKGHINYMAYYSENGKIRIDLPDMGNSNNEIYMIANSKTIDIVMPAKRMYMEEPIATKEQKDIEHNFDSESPSDNSIGTNDNSSDQSALENNFGKQMTGKTKIILGYKCREVVFPDRHGRSTHVWVTTDLGNVVMVQNPMSPLHVIKQIKKMNLFFPLLSEEFDRHGKLISKLEVVELHKGQLDENIFVIPSGYTRLGIPHIKF